jgi:CTP:molybdopterin cytidylyltransferase MocA
MITKVMELWKRNLRQAIQNLKKNEIIAASGISRRNLDRWLQKDLTVTPPLDEAIRLALAMEMSLDEVFLGLRRGASKTALVEIAKEVGTEFGRAAAPKRPVAEALRQGFDRSRQDQSPRTDEA